MAAGRFDEAAAIYARIASALPNDAGMLMNLGMAQSMAGHPGESIAPLERAVKLNPSLTPAWLFLGIAHVELDEPEQAIAPLGKVLSLDPSHVRARQMLARALVTVGRFDESVPHFRRAAELEPTRPAAWYALGRAYAAQSRAAYDALRQAAPQSPYLFVLAADTLAKQRRHAQAFHLYRRALEARPDLPGVRDAVAEIYRATGHSDWAREEIEGAKQAPPPDCRSARSACEFVRGDYDAAIAAARGRDDPESRYWTARAYDRLASRAFFRLGQLPPSTELHQLRASAYRDEGRYVDAVDELRRAAKLAPTDRSVQRELAIALYLSRDYEGARVLLSDLVERNPRSPELAFFYGDALLQSERVGDAIAMLKRAIELDAAETRARAALGRAYVLNGEAQQAIPHLKAVLGEDDDGSLHYQLARAYQMAGETDQARELLQKSEDIRKAAEARQRDRGEDLQITPPRTPPSS